MCATILEELKNVILETQETTEAWADFISLSIVGTVAGAKRPVRTKKGALGLNLFGCFIGPSGIANKTTPLKYILRPIFGFIKDTVEEDLLLPASFSVEGMTEYLANKEGKYSDEGQILKDEFTTLFKESVNKKYLTDEMEFYSHLYDGWVLKRFTRKTKLEHVEQVYVSLLGTTTPIIYSILSRNHFIQGLGNRIVWILYEEPKNSVVDPLRWTFDWQREQRDDSKLKDIAGTLVEMRKSKMGTMYLSDRASAMVEKLHQQIIVETKKIFKDNPRDIKHLYLSRQAERVLKLAGIYHFDHAWQNPKMNVISEKEIQWALPKVNKYYKDYLKMIEDWEVTGEAATIKTLEYYQTAMLRVIQRGQNRGLIVDSKYIHSKCQWIGVKVVDVLQGLVLNKKVNVKKEESGGRPRHIYSIP